MLHCRSLISAGVDSQRYVNPNWNGLDEIYFSCGSVGSRWTIYVTYVDASGVSQTNHLGGYCTDDPPQ